MKSTGPKVDRGNMQRLAGALLAAALACAGMLELVRDLLLPALARELTPAQLLWLREAFRMHPGWFLAAILALSTVLSLPVLLAALWTVRRGFGRPNVGGTCTPLPHALE